MPFESLGLIEPIVRAVTGEGYHTPTPIQAKSIPLVLAGRDLLGSAQTGTGKTAAFALPMLQRLSQAPASGAAHGRKRHIRALVLCPTRELASQIGESFQTYGRFLHLRHAVIYGGVGYHAQTDALSRGVDIVVATPGRMMDLMQQGHADISRVEVFVLDEADRMLDMGFIHDIRRVASKLPPRRQTLMFSATMPREIRRLADDYLHDPARVEVAPVASTAELVEQSVYHVDRRNKPALLVHVLRSMAPGARSLVFTRTKHGADRVVKQLHRDGVRSAAIHGNKRQNVRQRTLEAFRSGETPVLVATDIAARGIDIDDIALVINFDLPEVPETYVHRIGRTGRAGAAGLAVAFCDHDERPLLRDIERLTARTIPVSTDQPAYPDRPPAPPPARSHARPSAKQGARPNQGARPKQGGVQGRPHAPRPHDHPRSGHPSRPAGPSFRGGSGGWHKRRGR